MAKKRRSRKPTKTQIERIEEERIKKETLRVTDVIKQAKDQGQTKEKIRKARKGKGEPEEEEEEREEEPEQEEEDESGEEEKEEEPEKEAGKEPEEGEETAQEPEAEAPEETEVAPEAAGEAAEAGEEVAEKGGEAATEAGKDVAAAGKTGAAGAKGAGKGAIKGGIAGGEAGAGGALVAGQAGPQIALPEEAVTVPAATAGGAGAGAAGGAATEGTAEAAGTATSEAGKKGARIGARAAKEGAEEATEGKKKKPSLAIKIVTITLIILSLLIGALAMMALIASILIGYLSEKTLVGKGIKAVVGVAKLVDRAGSLNPFYAMGKWASKWLWNKYSDDVIEVGSKAIDETVTAVKNIQERIGCKNGKCQVPPSPGSKKDEGKFWSVAKAKALPLGISRKTQRELNNQLSQLLTNFDALKGIKEEGDGDQAIHLTVKNLKLTKLIRGTIKGLKKTEDRESILSELAKVEEFNGSILDSTAIAKYGPDREPLLQVGGSDIGAMLKGQVNVDRIDFLNHIGDQALEKADLPIYRLSPEKIGNILSSPPDQRAKQLAKVLDISPGWSQIKIADLINREGGLSLTSPKTSLSSVGKYYQEAQDGERIWLPAYVRYQAQYRPAELLKYRPPRNQSDLAADLSNRNYQKFFQVSPRTRSFDQLIVRLGVKAIGDELEINPEYLVNSQLTKESIGSAMLSDSLRLSPGSIEEIVKGESEIDQTLGRVYLENNVGLTNGSLTGGNLSEILENTGLCFLKDQFGLVNTGWDGSFENQSLGWAVLEQTYGTSDEGLIKELVEENLTQAQRKLGLSSLPEFNRLPEQVGESFKNRLFQIQNQRDLSISLGLYPRAMAELEANSAQAKAKIGARVLGNYLNIEANSETELKERISSAELPIEIDPGVIKALVSDNPTERDSQLSQVGQTIINNLSNQNLNPYLENRLTDTEQVKELFQNQGEITRLVGETGETALRELLTKDGPIIYGYLSGEMDWQDIEANKGIKPAYRIGAAFFDTRLNLPQNSTEMIVAGSDPASNAMAQVGLALTLREMGVNRIRLLGVREELGTDLTDRIGTLLVESQGLAIDSFQFDLSGVLRENGEARMATAFNLTKEQLKKAREKKADNRIENRLGQIDSSLRISSGTSLDLLAGQITVDRYARMVGRAGLKSSDSQFLGSSGWQADRLINHFSSCLSKRMGWPDRQALAQIRDPLAGRQAIVSTGYPQIRGFDQNLLGENFNQVLDNLVIGQTQKHLARLGARVSTNFIREPSVDKMAGVLNNIQGIDRQAATDLNNLYQRWDNNQLTKDQLFEELRTEKYNLTDQEVEDIFWAYLWETQGGEEPSVGFWIYLAYKLEIGYEIDEKTEVPYFTEGLIIGLMADDWEPLAMIVLAKAFDLGEELWLQNPAITSRYHGRELIGWALTGEVLPYSIDILSSADAEKLEQCIPHVSSGNQLWDRIEFGLGGAFPSF